MSSEKKKNPFEVDLEYPNATEMAATPKFAAEIKALYDKVASDTASARGYVFLSSLSFLFCPLGDSFLISACLIVLLSLVVYSYVGSTRSLTITYKIGVDARRIAEKRMLPFVQIARCSRVWQITSTVAVSDWKYNAGASQNVERKSVGATYGSPSQFSTNEKGVTLNLGGVKYVFMPDCIFVFGSEFSVLAYDQVKWSVSPYVFIESGSTPRDANVVGHTWQYVNKDGGPDRRFNYNPRYDKCQYGNVSLRFPGGRAVNLMISSSVVTDKLMQAMC